MAWITYFNTDLPLLCPRGTGFHFAHPPSHLFTQKKNNDRVFQAKSQVSLCGCNDTTEPSFETQSLVFSHLLAWACSRSSKAVLTVIYWVHVEGRLSVSRYKSWSVCVCARASIPQGPLLFPASLLWKEKFRESSRCRSADLYGGKGSD